MRRRDFLTTCSRTRRDHDPGLVLAEVVDLRLVLRAEDLGAVHGLGSARAIDVVPLRRTAVGADLVRAGEVGAVVSDATKGGYSQGTWSFGATVRARYAKSLSGLAVTHTTTHLKLAATLPD